MSVRAALLLLGAAWLIAGGLARAVAADDDLAESVRAVQQAAQSGDAKALAEFATASAPDPWRLASALCREGHRRAAEQLAAAGAEGAETAGLGAYVAAFGDPKEDPVRAVETALERARELGGQSDFAAQAEVLRGAASTSEGIGWLVKAADTWFRAGNAAGRVGDFEQAASSWSRCVAIGRPKAAADARYNLGSLKAMVADYDAALDLFELALAHFRTEKSDADVLQSLLNIALIHERRGDFERALPVLDEALTRTAAGSMGRAHVALQYAGVSLSLGETQSAKAQIDEAEPIFRAASDAVGIVRCIGQKSAVCAVAQEYEALRSLAQETLTALEDVPESSPDRPWFRAAALTNLGLALVELGRPLEGLPHLLEAVQVAEGLGDPALLAMAVGNAARGDLVAGELESAESRCRTLQALAEEHDLGGGQVRALWGLASVYLQRGELDLAADNAEAGLELLVTQTAGLAEGQSAAARSVHAELIEAALQIAVRRDDPAFLFHILERARATAFLATLTERETLRTALLDQRFRDEEDRLRAEVRKAAAMLAQTPGARRDPLRLQRRADLATSRVNLRRGIAKTQREAKAGGALLYPAFATLEQIQASLGEGDVLIVFAQLKAEVLALLVERTSARIAHLGAADGIAALGRTLSSDEEDAHGAVTTLARRVLAPLEVAHAKRLLIAPDGALVEIPFAALAPGKDIAYVPSGGVYALLTKDRGRTGTGVLGLGDPSYDEARNLSRLPATRAEVAAVADVELLGKDATLARLVDAVGSRKRWSAVHFACHGAFDLKHPLESGLELTDGRLDANRIFTLSLPAELVVLSACETGRGAYYPGEGVVGLTRAVMFAGAPRVLCSLWRVDDAATKALMTKFYALRNAADGSTGHSTAEALRRAQEFVRGQEKWKHPRYWAAWTLWGLPD